MLPQLPTPKQEDWKYTNLSRYYDPKEVVNAVLPEPDLEDYYFSAPAFSHHAFAAVAGGHFCRNLLQLNSTTITVSALEQPRRCSKTSFTDVSVQQNFQAGCHVKVAATCNGETVYLANTQNAASQTIVDVAAGANVTVVESFYTPNHQQAHSSQLNIGANAHVRYIRLCSASQTLLAETTINLSENSNVECFSLSENSTLNRHDVWLNHTQQGSHATFNAVQLGTQKSHLDTNLRCHHTQPNCSSTVLCQQVATDSAHTIFQGKFSVAKEAQQTDATMLCKNLPLSAKARCTSKPELEIYADDVKCSHGNTCGALDENALFYLQARGISPQNARHMVLEGMLTSTLPTNLAEDLKTHINHHLTTWLNTVV